MKTKPTFTDMLAERARRERALKADMADAHAHGYHAEYAREGCPECVVQFRGRRS